MLFHRLTDTTGVSAAILLFAKGGTTSRVFFYNVGNDGYSLDDKRNKIDLDDLPDVAACWSGRRDSGYADRTSKTFFVNKGEIAAKDYSLSFNRYKESAYEEVRYEHPLVLLDKLEEIEQSVQLDLRELRTLLR